MIVCSCGCIVETMDDVHEAVLKYISRDMGKALSYELICIKHLDEYKKNNMLFDNDEQAQQWLTSKEPWYV